MKHIFLFTCIFLFICSCSDSVSDPIQPIQDQNIELRRAPNMNVLWAEAILNRSYNPTPGDPGGEVCECMRCWGICTAMTPIGLIGNIILAVQPDEDNNVNGQTRIYFANPLEDYDAEFGIDDDVVVDPEILEGSEFHTLILKTGIYNTHDEEGEIEINGEWVPVYGHVDVNDYRE